MCARLAGLSLLALAPSGGTAAAGEACKALAKARYQQDRTALTEKVRALQASNSGDNLKDRGAYMELMTEIQAAENRYRAAIGKCNAAHR